jgi:hypothetical protein
MVNGTAYFRFPNTMLWGAYSPLQSLSCLEQSDSLSVASNTRAAPPMNVTRKGKGARSSRDAMRPDTLVGGEDQAPGRSSKKEFLVIIFPGDLPALKVAASPVPAPLDSRRLQPPLPLSASTTPPRPCDVIQ